ncbi:MAG: hypothetical protein ACREMB_11940 [Candidatus Rokuibacteriota bacterium]
MGEIVERARKEAAYPELRPGVYVHVVQHCVANRPPNPGRYRMLLESGENRRRLFREGDPYDPGRDGSKVIPSRDAIPAAYQDLLAWYHSEYTRRRPETKKTDPLLDLRGSGRELWAREHADEYVRRLRAGWE